MWCRGRMGTQGALLHRSHSILMVFLPHFMLFFSWNFDFSGTTYHRDSKPVPLDLACLKPYRTFGKPLGQADLQSDIPCPLVDASSGQEQYYIRSAWHLVSLWVRLTFSQMYSPGQRYLVAKNSGTTSGQIDIWSAFGSGWPVYVRVNLVPAAAVIPAPWVDIKVVAVKKLICYCLQFSIDHLLVLMSTSSL